MVHTDDFAPEIAAAEDRLRTAMLAGDAGALDALISDRLLFAGPNGALASKADDLQSHATRAVRFLEHEPESLDMRRVNDDCYVVSLATRLVVEVAGTVHRGRFRYMRVWVRTVAGWEILAGQVSAIQEAS